MSQCVVTKPSTTTYAAGVGTPEQSYGVECELAPGQPGNLHATQPWLIKKRKPLQRWPRDTAYDTTCYTYTFTKHDNVPSLASLVDPFELNIRSLVPENLDLWWPPVAFTYKFPYIFKPVEEGTITAVLNIARNATYDITRGDYTKQQYEPYFKCSYYDASGTRTPVQCTLESEPRLCTRIGTVACGLVYYDMNLNNTLNPGTRVSTCISMAAIVMTGNWLSMICLVDGTAFNQTNNQSL
jgi:hypothetical protein